MKAALSFASAACLPAALSQPVQAQADWHRLTRIVPRLCHTHRPLPDQRHFTQPRKFEKYIRPVTQRVLLRRLVLYQLQCFGAW